MKALILDASNCTANIKLVPDPTPGHLDILIQVSYVALNPVDALYTYQPLGSSGRVVGSDFAGTVVSLGSSVPSSSIIKPGDRVAGFLQANGTVNTTASKLTGQNVTDVEFKRF